MHITSTTLLTACGILFSITHTAKAAEDNSTDIIEEFSKLKHKFLYDIHYLSSGCNTSSAVNIESIVATVPHTFQYPEFYSNPNITSSSTLCATNVECAVRDVLSPDQCPIQNTVIANYNNEDEINVSLVSSNGTIVKPLGFCELSQLYGNCYFTWTTLDTLKANPELLANDNEEDLEVMQNYIYYAFYEDDECTDLASIFSSVSGETVDVPIVSENNYSCAVGSVCALNEDSDLCKAMKSDSIGTFTSITSVDEETGEVDVYDCDTSNAAIDQDECSVIKPTQCIKSSLVAGCHLRFFSGVEFANNPRALLFGEVGDTSVGTNSGDSDVEEDPQDDMNADEKEEIEIEEGYDESTEVQDTSGVSIISLDMFTSLFLVFTLLLV